MTLVHEATDDRRTMESRALVLWPRLDRAALRRCAGDPGRIADLVARRTRLPPESIRMLLLMQPVTDAEVGRWFG